MAINLYLNPVDGSVGTVFLCFGVAPNYLAVVNYIFQS
jgi:hypothetical protein